MGMNERDGHGQPSGGAAPDKASSPASITPFVPVPAPMRSVRLTPVIWLPGESPPAAAALALSDAAFELCPPMPAPPPPRPFLMPAAPRGAAPMLPPVMLVRLRAYAVVFGGTRGVAATEGRYVAETLPAGLGDDFRAIDAVAPFDLPALDIGGEVLLASATGADTAEGWMATGLPRVAMAEAAFPGRFRYMLPPCGAASLPAAALRGLGIAADRLVPKRPDRAYRCAALWLVLGASPDDLPHPTSLAALRQGQPGAGAARLAITATEPRPVAAAEAMTDLLAGHGFACVAEAAAWPALAGARLVFFWPGVADALLMAGAPGLAAIIAEPDQATSALRRAVLGALHGSLAELPGSASEAAVSGEIALDLSVLTTLLENVPGGGQ